MSESTFFRAEKIKNDGSVLRMNVRLFTSLPLFMRLLPLSLLLIFVSSAGPSVFRWYSGKFASGEAGFTFRGLVAVVGLAVFTRITAWISFEISGMWAAQSLHDRMVQSLSHTRTTYFDENPSGRLLQRLIGDFDEVRMTAIIFVGDLLNALIEVLGIAVIAYLASPLAGILVIPLLLIFSYVQFYRSAMLAHARSFSAAAMGSVIARETDLIEGREIFLLYGKAGRLLSRMANQYRTYLHGALLTTRIDAWSSFWMRFSAEIFSFGVLLFTVHALHRGEIEATFAGVVISSLFGVTGSIGWLDVATGLVSRAVPHVRRVFEIIDLPREERDEGAPHAGSVLAMPMAEAKPLRFVNYAMSYRADTPVILQDLNLEIPAGMKIALIGRTGSGKTSITQALLRMVHVRSGDLRLGDDSIYSLDLREVRRQFGVIPQTPYLFAGTLRSNLDFEGTRTDSELLAALALTGLPFPLDLPINEGGTGLSQGERQLVCLARVIALKKPYIILDEATSGLDPVTDARITRVIREGFAGKTVITIAHRPESLRDYDRIVELRDGRIVRANV